MIVNIFCRGNNDLLKNGKLDEQIIADLENYLDDRRRYQEEHLDVSVKGKSHHYEEWTEENQLVIKYTEHLLECVKAQMKDENTHKVYGKIINKKPCLIIGAEIIPITDYIKLQGDR